MPPQPLSLYVHIPFCRARCPYCDFNTYAGRDDLILPYLRALAAEAELWSQALAASDLDFSVVTLYFGGGTPSLLSPSQIGGMLMTLRGLFSVPSGAEISMEANPGTVTYTKLKELHRRGVNRLSIGVQSFDDRLLKVLGRQHSAAQAQAAYQGARRAAFSNVNLDLIYGIPAQSLIDWSAELQKAVSLEPEHLSLYPLTVEEGTPMAQWMAEGRMASPDPDLAADMYEMAEERLAKAGYRHYEISNWARPGKECAHNLTYWRNQPYLGLGAGAHSCLAGCRFSNLRLPQSYIERLRDGEPAGLLANLTPAGDALWQNMPWQRSALEAIEPITPEVRRAETLIMGLRLEEGVNLSKLASPLPYRYQGAIAELAAVGLLTQENDSLRLTPRGRLLANEVFQRFWPPNPAAG